MSARVGTIAALVLALAAGCGRAPAVPPLPDLEDVAPAARAQLRRAHAAVAAEPRSADRWGRLAIAYRIYGYPERGDAAYELARRLAPDDYRWPYCYGSRLVDEDVPRALAMLEESLALRDDHALLHVTYARALDRAGRAEEAEAAWRRALALEPDNVHARVGLARALLQTDDVAGAEALLADSAARGAAHRLALSTLSELHRRRGDSEQAAAYALQAAEAPNEVRPFDLDRVAAEGGPEGRRVVLARAMELARDDRAGEADELVRRFCELDPDDPFAHLAAGQYLVERRRFAEGLASLRTALRLDPRLTDARLALADALRLADRPDEAYREYERVLRSRRFDLPARRGMAACLARMDRIDEAVAGLAALLRAAPDDRDTRAVLARIQFMAGDLRGCADTLAPLARDAGAAPDAELTELLAMAGMCRFRLQEHEAAQRLLRRVLEQRPDWRDVRRAAAGALLRLDRPDEAVEVLRAGLDAAAPDAQLAFDLAWILATHPAAGVRDGAAAVELAEAVLAARGRGDPRALDLLACAAAETGRFDEAAALEREAMAVLERAGDEAGLRTLRERHDRFERRRPWRERGGGR
ncbi:MAG: tetratricopeptide repeat protein [Planctomycetota bacterium]